MNGNSGSDVDIFTAAVQLPVGERSAFLDRACVGDDLLRQKIEAWLASSDRAGAFLEDSPGEVLEMRGKASVGEKPGDRIDQYVLLRQIGEGGCGVVFLAEQQEPILRRVALKVVKPGMDTRSVMARFEAERQALALMDHPNIARVFDAGATGNGRPYFVMELVEGIRITDYCDENSLPTRARLDLFIQVCDAVQHAHQKGIIHRDLKPSNILVTTGPDVKPAPKVIDFGIAKATNGQQLTDKTIFTACEMLIGTPAYMSPEQAALTGGEVDTRTDIYSLGVLLYELLTGATPFDARELLKAGFDEVRRVIRDTEPLRPSTRLGAMRLPEVTGISRLRQAEPPALIREVRGDLDWIVMKALEKERARRYKTANGLGLDVQRYLADEAVSARPPTKLYRLKKTILRNKLLFASAGTIASLLMVGLVVVSLAFARERQSRREADAASHKSRQVTKFLEEMLQGVGPSVALGEDTRLLRRILDQTAERVGRDMADQPMVEAELRNFIAGLYEELGHADKAEDMARRALAIHQKHQGADSLEAAASLNILGLQFMAQHKLTEAEKAHGDALAIRRRRLGGEHADTATSLNDLSAVYREQGKTEAAEIMGREALRVRRKLFGVENLEVADSLRNLCIIQGVAGKWVQAEETAREALAMKRALLPSEHPWIASALEDHAWTLNALDRFDEALALDEEALLMRQKLLGNAHPDVPRNLNALGQLLQKRGDLQASEGVLKAVLSIQRNLFGENHTATLETFCSLATVLDRAGKRGEAESLWREALAVWRKRGEYDKQECLYALRGLGESLENQGKWSEAEELWRESLALWRKRGGVEERQSMYTLRKLGLALEAERKWPEAESVHREALTVSGQKGEEDPEALVDLERLVRVLMAAQRFAEAEHLLDQKLTPAFVARAASLNLVVQRVNVMGRRGRWREAAADAALALQNQPLDHYRHHTLAALLAITQDRPAYQKLCGTLLSKFAETTDPYVAERVAQDCLLLPDSGVDLDALDKLADKAVRLGSADASLAYFQGCKAMSSYRLGRYPEAVAWAERALQGARADPEAKAKACAVSALAHWKLGQGEVARSMLARGESMAPRVANGGGVTDIGESWVAWLIARATLDEAASLIHPPPPLSGHLVNP